MNYVIDVKLMFPSKADSDEVWAKLKAYLKDKKIVSLVNEQSFIKYHECYHDEGSSCKDIEYFEV